MLDFYDINWATPILIFAIASVFILATQKLAGEHLAKWGFSAMSKEIEVDEDLPNFFSSITLRQANEMVMEE